MALTVPKLQTKLMRDYYKYFSKYSRGKLPDRKVAWVTSFAPVEILESLDIACYYPESYAAVIAASGKEQPFLAENNKGALSCDCCSYSCCFEGSLTLQDTPRGSLPKADILVAASNQCNKLPNWWNTLSQKFKIPLVVIDYPGENASIASYDYVTAQHKELIAKAEQLSGNSLEIERLSAMLDLSQKSVTSWKKIVELFPKRELTLTSLFDDMSFLISSRCKPETSELYELLVTEYSGYPLADMSKPGLFWLGYPLWYHQKRYLAELLDSVRICGSNYITWWNLDYSGNDPFERLYNAYNSTFLNLAQRTKQAKLSEAIRKSEAVGAIALRNKSCKCDFVSSRSVRLPQAEIEIDMIDREFLDMGKAKRQIEQLLESL